MYRPKIWRAASAVILLSQSHSPIAQEELETVLVTASRTPIQAEESGSSNTIIEREELDYRQLAPLSEILRGVPGLAVSRSGVLGSSTQIRMRGAEANQVLVLIDGVEANDIAQGSEFNFANLMTAEIDRIEVVRGPQSSLWGSDAMAGVVNIITRPGDGPPRVQGFSEAGSFGSFQAGGSAAGGIGQFQGRIAGSHLQSSGSNISRAGDEDDGYENDTLSFHAKYEVNALVSLSAAGRHTEAENEFDNFDFLTGLPGDGDSVTKLSQDYGRSALDVSLLDGRWEHRVAGNVTATENDNFLNGIEDSSTQGRKYKIEYQTSLAVDNASVDDARHVLTAVVEHESEDYTQRGQASPFGDPNLDLATHSLGLAGEYRARLTEDLTLSTSGRFDDNSDFKDSVTFRVAGAYRVSATGTRLHAAYGEGVKNPGFSERFGFYTSESFPFVGNADLKPEESRGWEIGITQGFLDERLRLGAAWFDEDLLDEINGFVFDPVLFVFTAENVDGKSHRNGLELSGDWLPIPALQLSASYTYVDATEPDGLGGQQRELRRPGHSGNLNLNYSFFDKRANLNANLHVNGEQVDLFFPPLPPFLPERVVLDDYLLLTLAGSWRHSDTLTFYARVENLLDERYEEVLGFQTPGIAAFAGVRVGFGL